MRREAQNAARQNAPVIAHDAKRRREIAHQRRAGGGGFESENRQRQFGGGDGDRRGRFAQAAPARARRRGDDGDDFVFGLGERDERGDGEAPDAEVD